MNVITDPKQAGERLLQFAREGRLVQHTWHDEEEGREIACLLGAAAGIDGVSQCPASLMPKWLAQALPSLFDGQMPAHAQTFARRWGEAMIRPEWTRIDWFAVRGEWLAFVGRQAQDAACSASIGAKEHAKAAAADDADYANDAAKAAAYANVYDRYASWVAAYAAARDAQADALMTCIERAMEVARG